MYDFFVMNTLENAGKYLDSQLQGYFEEALEIVKEIRTGDVKKI